MAGTTKATAESNIEGTENAQPAGEAPKTTGAKVSRSSAIKNQRDELDPGPYVKYKGAREGIASLRQIKSAEWAQVANDPPKNGFADVEWSVRNDFRVHEDEFTDGQLAYLYNVDDAFETVEIAYDGDTETIVETVVD